MSASAVEILCDLDEYFAGGFFELEDQSPMLRWSRAVRRELEHRNPGEIRRGLLYPTGPSILRSREEADRILKPNLVSTWTFDRNVFQVKWDRASGTQRAVLDTLRYVMEDLIRQLTHHNA